jgi:hypothetical protein
MDGVDDVVKQLKIGAEAAASHTAIRWRAILQVTFLAFAHRPRHVLFDGTALVAVHDHGFR